MKRSRQSNLITPPSHPASVQVDRRSVQSLANGLAIPMFCLSLAFLVLLAGLTVVWVDMAMPQVVPVDSTPVPDAIHPGSEATDDAFTQVCQSANVAGYVLFGLLLAIWPCFILEPVVCRWYGRRYQSETQPSLSADLWTAICPPLRLAKPNTAQGGRIWLPGSNWHLPGKPLAKRLERVFSKPMLMIAMAILPILLIEFGFSKQVQSMPILKLALSICTGLIWCAFAIEFIVMFSATDKKLAYVKKNWIDLAIILLPLVSFLRSLRIVRTANIAKFAKVQQLSKMSRIYRMRGLMAKSIRALMVLEIMHRVLKRTPEKRISKLKTQLADLEEEASDIRTQIKRLESLQVTNQSSEEESPSRRAIAG